MFNQSKKEEFLNDVRMDTNIKSPEETAKAYGRIFISSEPIEDKYNKDLYDFDIKQLEELFIERQPKTKTASRTAGRIVTKYINWAIHKGYREDKKNPLDVSQEFFNKFVPEEKTQYLTVDEIQDTVDYLINDQDAVIVALLFNGVQGKEASEIRNLTKDDISYSKKELYVIDDKYLNELGKYEKEAYRMVSLENDGLNTLGIIKRAYNDPEYVKRNGEMESIANIKDSVRLPTPSETPYIVKSGKTQQTHYGERAKQYTVYNRIDMMKTLKGLSDYSEKLNTKNIVRSGMIFEAKRLLELEGGELDNEKLKKVCKKFNVKNHWAVRDFLNMEVIESLYGKIKIKNISK